ncbi:MAG: transposase [Oscillospiraceae bacterium]|nr:transposase [bacterium]MBR0486056.1 transposase [Oscillospiraceae bacterium]
MNRQFFINTSLQYENKRLKRLVKEFENGERYKKLQHNHHLIYLGYQRRIKQLSRQVQSSKNTVKKVLDIWYEQLVIECENHTKELNEKIDTICKLRQENYDLFCEYQKKLAKKDEEYQKALDEKDTIIETLKAEIRHMKAVQDRDGTNTSLPTSQTPIGKSKARPNSREETDNFKGGQTGHKRSELEPPAEEAITDIAQHCLTEDDCCPKCKKDEFEYTGKTENRYEIEVEVKVKRVKHKYYVYKCKNCGTLVISRTAPEKRTKVRYGANVQAMILVLLNIMNSSINKVPVFFQGITNGEISPSEGYVAKVQARAAKALAVFHNDLRRELLKRLLIYWDDTVVYADTQRICLRFYGDERIAFFAAHENKDMNGILLDGILENLSAETSVMHDHNSINYNERFVFINIECNAHLQRDLQKLADETNHEVLLEIKALISATIKDRKNLVQAGTTRFDDGYLENFESKLTELLQRAETLAEANTSKYSGGPERALIRRIIKYRSNYFAWVYDFSLPTTNNLSERALRGTKTKMKVSGQFSSSKTANNYAMIRTYIETCRRNGINEYDALTRLCDGNPYTVEEIFAECE